MYKDDLMKSGVRNVKANIAAARRAAQDGVKRSTCDVTRRIFLFEDYSSTMTQSAEEENSVSQILAFLQGKPSWGSRIFNQNISFSDNGSNSVRINVRKNHEALASIGSCRGGYS
jgi:hypothetical protein